MNVYLAIFLSLMLCGIAVALIYCRSVFGVTVLLSVYSGVLCVTFTLLGAVDVGFTEAVVGTGISTGVFIALLRQVHAEVRAEKRGSEPPGMGQPGWIGVAVGMLAAVGLGAVMLNAAHSLHPFGDPESTPYTYVASDYIRRSEADTHTPNVVTAVLADYRGFDTLIETSVVLTGALACLLILRRGRNAESSEA